MKAQKPKISRSPKPSPQTAASNLETEPYNPEEFRNWLQSDLRLATAYWQHKIQPYINGRKLRYAEFEIALDAHSRVENAFEKARIWNAGKWPLGDKCNGNDGKKFSISAAEIRKPDGFRKPEPLEIDKSLKPETLAAIAAPMFGKRGAKLSNSDAVRFAHDLLTAAKDYLDILRKPQTHGVSHRMTTGPDSVSVAEIEQSNKKESGQMPLLPSVQNKRNESQLTPTAIRAAVSRFYKLRTD